MDKRTHKKVDIELMKNLMQVYQFNKNTLAEKSGVSNQTIAKVLKGNPARISTIEKIAGALKTTSDNISYFEIEENLEFLYKPDHDHKDYIFNIEEQAVIKQAIEILKRFV